ncbi:hypothetical protein MIND_00945400 [Mycena indigotica]|uniref:Yeast cell wall synthesis Kre9/Knh1-like N-terminal domain-containing protein n=1 Tax=Mycena indigotica TaxID=2126181 RepID=A0A8H6SCQ1_9AGAR|nr:uncharacterized protein MIND_00945400 [Mycena indigotica]KAF7297125.1 hypothetical protein MIND_00945400 [Mycena indigotica]
MFSVSSAVVALALAKVSFAALSFTAPTATIGFTGGQDATITWVDDNTQPPLSAYGPMKASIYAGNSQQQTSLQTIAESIDVTTLSLKFKPDASIGPNSNQYFIRFEALTTKDPNNAAIPLLAFSHQFALSSMTGVFNAAVQAQIDGQSTAPIGGAQQTSAPASVSKPASATSSPAKASAPVSGSPSKSSRSAAPSGSSAALPLVASSNGKLWVGIVTGVAGAVMGAALL